MQPSVSLSPEEKPKGRKHLDSAALATTRNHTKTWWWCLVPRVHYAAKPIRSDSSDEILVCCVIRGRGKRAKTMCCAQDSGFAAVAALLPQPPPPVKLIPCNNRTLTEGRAARKDAIRNRIFLCGEGNWKCFFVLSCETSVVVVSVCMS